MNCKLNKFFLKSCASILAVSNIFSEVGAVSPKKSKAESSQISLTKGEFRGSIFATAGLSILATLLLNKKCGFLVQPKSTKSDTDQTLNSIILALNKTDMRSKDGNNQSSENFSETLISGRSEECPLLTDEDSIKRHKEPQFVTEEFLSNQLKVDSKEGLLRAIQGRTPVICPSGKKYIYKLKNTTNPSCLSGHSGDLMGKLDECLKGLESDVVVMQLVNMTNHISHSKCTVLNVKNIANLKVIRSMGDDSEDTVINSESIEGMKSDLCFGESNSMLLTVGYWEECKDDIGNEVPIRVGDPFNSSCF